jgi:hypothetical protein
MNVTVAANRVDGGAGLTNGPAQGGGLGSTNATVIVRNSIVANSPNGGDTWGAVTDAGYNICSDGTANFSATGSLSHADPLLSTLSSNGGSTATMYLLAGSPARDAIPSGFPPTDQRGVLRPQGPAADIGAVEADFVSPPSTPRILSQPVSVIVPPGAATNFSVVAAGPSLTYQWWHNDVAVSGVTAATLTLDSALAGAQGDYFAVVSNYAGMATSMVATLTFNASALSIQVPPRDATVVAGYPASFSVLVSGVPPFAYQWEHNGTPIPGATSSAYTIGAVTTNYAGNYDVVVTNGYRIVSSPPAMLTVTPGAVPPLLEPGRFGQSLTITFSAEAGRTYRLLSSTNLTAWLPVATNAAIIAGPLQFVQPINAGPPKFYRVITP